jgi:hypothetical protein
MFELVHLVLDLLKPSEGGERRFVHSRSRFEMNMLREQPELQTARTYDFTAVGAFFARYEAEDRCLTRAVPTDQSDVLCGIDLQ